MGTLSIIICGVAYRANHPDPPIGERDIRSFERDRNLPRRDSFRPQRDRF